MDLSTVNVLVPAVLNFVGILSISLINAFAKRSAKKASQKQNEKIETANSALKSQIDILNVTVSELKDRIIEITESPLSQNSEGFYTDSAHNAYCGGGCRDTVTGRRIPLSVQSRSGSWVLYRCPMCKTRYETGEPPRQPLPLDDR